jgi:hypothetical protein
MVNGSVRVPEAPRIAATRTSGSLTKAQSLQMVLEVYCARSPAQVPTTFRMGISPPGIRVRLLRRSRSLRPTPL